MPGTWEQALLRFHFLPLDGTQQNDVSFSLAGKVFSSYVLAWHEEEDRDYPESCTLPRHLEKQPSLVLFSFASQSCC